MEHFRNIQNIQLIRRTSRLYSTRFLPHIIDFPDDVCNIIIYAMILLSTVSVIRKWLVDCDAGKTLLVSFDGSINTGAIDVRMDGSVYEEKSSYEVIFFSPQVALYLPLKI